MFAQTFTSPAPRALPRKRKIAPEPQGVPGFDPCDPLHSIREFRLRKVATKRIPSRIS